MGAGDAHPRRRVDGRGVGRVDAPVDEFDPKPWLSSAVLASLAANELARAMGMRDLYPFALSAGARRRIEAAWHLVRGATTKNPTL